MTRPMAASLGLLAQTSTTIYSPLLFPMYSTWQASAAVYIEKQCLRAPAERQSLNSSPRKTPRCGVRHPRTSHSQGVRDTTCQSSSRYGMTLLSKPFTRSTRVASIKRVCAEIMRFQITLHSWTTSAMFTMSATPAPCLRHGIVISSMQPYTPLKMCSIHLAGATGCRFQKTPTVQM